MIVNTIPDNSCKLFTIVRKSCSRCAGISVHDPPETLFTIARNTQALKSRVKTRRFNCSFLMPSNGLCFLPTFIILLSLSTQ